MLKKVLFSALLIVLYLLAFGAGSFLHPLGFTSVLASNGLAARIFIWDGVLLMLVVFGISLGAAALGKRLVELWLWIGASLVFAALLGYLLRLGFVTRDF